MRGTSLGLFVIAAAALLVGAGYGLWLRDGAVAPAPDDAGCAIARGHGVGAPAPEAGTAAEAVAAPGAVARSTFTDANRAGPPADAARLREWEIDFDEAFPQGVDGFYRDIRAQFGGEVDASRATLRVRLTTPDGADFAFDDRYAMSGRASTVRFADSWRSTVAYREGSVVRFAPGTELDFGGPDAKHLLFLPQDRPWAATPPGAASPDAAAPRASVCRPVRARFRARIVDARGETVADGAFVETRRVPDEHGVFVVPTGPGRFDVVASAEGERLSVRATSERHAPSPWTEAPSGGVEIDLRLGEPYGRIAGRALLGDAPPGDVSIVVAQRREDGASSEISVVAPSPDGSFSSMPLPPSAYDVRFRLRTALAGADAFLVVEGATPTDSAAAREPRLNPIDLRDLVGAAAVRVTDEAGAPIMAEAFVVGGADASPTSVGRTDEKGERTFAALRRDPLLLRFRGRDRFGREFSDADARCFAGETTVVVLRPYAADEPVDAVVVPTHDPALEALGARWRVKALLPVPDDAGARAAPGPEPPPILPRGPVGGGGVAFDVRAPGIYAVRLALEVDAGAAGAGGREIDGATFGDAPQIRILRTEPAQRFHLKLPPSWAGAALRALGAAASR